MPIKVAVVEDNAGVCQELALLISREEDMVCCATCRNAATALATLPALMPDVILMDIQLPGRSGVQCVQRIKPLLPETQIVMFTINEDAHVVTEALASGAIGYLVKSSTSEQIVAGIRSAFRREAPITSGLIRKLVENLHRLSPRPALEAKLTFREEETVKLVAQGLSDKQIAEHLHISLQTVNSHLKNIYAKLEVHSRAELTAKYLQQPKHL